MLGLGLGLGLGLVLISILLISLSSRLCLYAGCTLVSKSAGFSIPSTYLALIILSSLISCMRLSFKLKVVLTNFSA